MTKVKLTIIAFAILIPLMVGVGSAFSAGNQKDCEDLKAYVESLTDEALVRPITNVQAIWNSTYCEVRGRIFPETDFAVRLPTNWNGRTIHFGGGGWDGMLGISGSQITTTLNLGYVCSESNGGHNGRPIPPFGPLGDGSFGLKDPYYRQWIDPNNDNPYACQKIVDFGNRALREVPLVARKIVKQYYGSSPHHSYYSGGSTGGREGLVEAQKNWDLFDGVYIGFPTGGHIPVCSRGLWDSIQGVGSGLLASFSTKAVALRNAVYGKCDGVDGLIDGLIDDPRKCDFDPLTDLPACPNDVDAAGCFTLAQRNALKEIYRGPHNSSGQLYVGTALSAEYLIDPTNPTTSGFSMALYDPLMSPLFQYIVFDPPPGPTWNMFTFNWDTDVTTVKESTCTQCYGSQCTTYQLTDELDAVTYSYPVAPNMGGFAQLRDKGGKIIHYHGWSDGLVSPFTSVSLYETVMQQMGVEETKNFWKLYMVPGMGHGTPGIGTPQDWLDGFQKLVNWVEDGEEPTSLLGMRAPNPAWGWPATTRPLCPYPEVARYLGAGSIDEAANFGCVETVQAHVRIEPDRLSLTSGKPYFTALIELPHQGDWRATSAVCEGAPAVRLTRHGYSYKATFNKQDLINITAGDEVTFTVTLFVERQGHHYGERQGHHCAHPDDTPIAFEGSDTVKVME
jgi:feruloyl esterase